jgi:hypothetical protein
VRDDSLENLLRSAARDKTVKGQPFEIRRIKPNEYARDCKMAFVSSSEPRQVPSVIASFEGVSTVTVSDWPDFAKAGGMIAFSVTNSQVHFEVNVEAAKRAHLTISSKLLSLAKIVGN